MNKENGYSYDEKLNIWDSRIFTEEQAIMYSVSLKDCESCKDSSACMNCYDCMHCRDCMDCLICTNCYDCTDCRSCMHCRDCSNCVDCRDCRNCANCASVHGCSDYIGTPMSYTTRRIGSRNDNTTFYYGDTKNGKSLQVVCGCFHGNLEEFEKAVKEKHGNNKYVQQYMAEIQKVKLLFNLGNI